MRQDIFFERKLFADFKNIKMNQIRSFETKSRSFFIIGGQNEHFLLKNLKNCHETNIIKET